VICGSPIIVVSRVASAVGVGEEPGRPLLETLTDALRPRRLLLTLDNCEHLIDACARLCQRLLASSPDLRVIATSREPLHVAAETVWQVQPLSVAPGGAATAPGDAFRYEAIRLFVTRPPRRFPVLPLPGQRGGRRGGLPRAGRGAAGD
jgi:non-specific serine/threonine protein kinase